MLTRSNNFFIICVFRIAFLGMRFFFIRKYIIKKNETSKLPPQFLYFLYLANISENFLMKILYFTHFYNLNTKIFLWNFILFRNKNFMITQFFCFQNSFFYLRNGTNFSTKTNFASKTYIIWNRPIFIRG